MCCAAPSASSRLARIRAAPAAAAERPRAPPPSPAAPPPSPAAVVPPAASAPFCARASPPRGSVLERHQRLVDRGAVALEVARLLAVSLVVALEPARSTSRRVRPPAGRLADGVQRDGSGWPASARSAQREPRASVSHGCAPEPTPTERAPRGTASFSSERSTTLDRSLSRSMHLDATSKKVTSTRRRRPAAAAASSRRDARAAAATSV